MSKTVKCKNCGVTFPDNPEKHRHRQKLCPVCRTPYTKTGITWKPSTTFKHIKESLQKMFKFFPSVESRKQIFYECPSCNHQVLSEQELQLDQIPDKTKTTPKGETVVLTYRYIPKCPRCGTYMTRRRVKK